MNAVIDVGPMSADDMAKLSPQRLKEMAKASVGKKSLSRKRLFHKVRKLNSVNVIEYN